MHEEVLSESQEKLLPLLSNFSGDFGLVGGTAVALQIGHRRSIDFVMTTSGELKSEMVLGEIRKSYKIQKTIIDEAGEISVVVESVKLSFIKYPFPINFEVDLDNIIRMPSIKTLAAMKAYVLGRRAKWKDYVDLYFILQDYSLGDIVSKSREIFGDEFNEKQFREQLSYFEDIDYSEAVDFMNGKEVDDEEIKDFLIDLSLEK